MSGHGDGCTGVVRHLVRGTGGSSWAVAAMLEVVGDARRHGGDT